MHAAHIHTRTRGCARIAHRQLRVCARERCGPIFVRVCETACLRANVLLRRRVEAARIRAHVCACVCAALACVRVCVGVE